MEPRVPSASTIKDSRVNQRLINLPESPDVIQSSFGHHSQLPRYASPLFFNLFSNFYSLLLDLITTSITTITSTLTSTITSYKTTDIKPFTISGCSPATLYFSTCKFNSFNIWIYHFKNRIYCIYCNYFYFSYKIGSKAAFKTFNADGVSAISTVVSPSPAARSPSVSTVTVTVTGNNYYIFFLQMYLINNFQSKC